MWPFDNLSAEEEKCVVVIFFIFLKKFFIAFSNSHNHNNNRTKIFFQTHKESCLKNPSNVSLKYLVRNKKYFYFSC